MNVRVVNKKEWAREIERGLKKRKMERTISKKMRWTRFKEDFPIPLVVGIIACFAMMYFYSPRDLGRTFLSWTIGSTFMAFLFSWFGLKK